MDFFYFVTNSKKAARGGGGVAAHLRNRSARKSAAGQRLSFQRGSSLIV